MQIRCTCGERPVIHEVNGAFRIYCNNRNCEHYGLFTASQPTREKALSDWRRLVVEWQQEETS